MYTFVYYSFKIHVLSYGTEMRYGSIIFNVRFTIFLCIGVTLACFQISDNIEEKKELLKRSVSGADITSANSLSILLFNKSGPEAFPVAGDFNTELTPSNSRTILFKV